MRIVVAGAGPAGVATAKRLAELGHEMVLLAPRRRPPCVEGLSFRVLDGLRIAGIDDTGLVTPVPRIVRWNGRDRQVGQEFLAERERFDDRLAEAARAFADIRPAALVRSIPNPGTSAGLTVEIEAADGGPASLAADFLVDARGRGAPGAARLVGPRTLALCRRYAKALPPGSWVESGREGWAWLASAGDGTAFLQLAVAAPHGGTPPAAELAAHVDRLVATLPATAALLDAAAPASPVIARLATASAAQEPAGSHQIRVGDAALALDPLSGHGVYEAIAGAFAAAAVVNTILRRPEDTALAVAFYRDRLHSTFLSRAHHGRTQYASETRWPGSPFWAERRAWPEPARSPRITAPLVETRGVIDDGWIRQERVFVTADQPRGVWRLDGVPVVALAELRASGQVDGAEAAAKALGCSLAAARSALAWLDRNGLGRRIMPG